MTLVARGNYRLNFFFKSCRFFRKSAKKNMFDTIQLFSLNLLPLNFVMLPGNHIANYRKKFSVSHAKSIRQSNRINENLQKHKEITESKTNRAKKKCMGCYFILFSFFIFFFFGRMIKKDKTIAKFNKWFTKMVTQT